MKCHLLQHCFILWHLPPPYGYRLPKYKTAVLDYKTLSTPTQSCTSFVWLGWKEEEEEEEEEDGKIGVDLEHIWDKSEEQFLPS